MVMDGIKVTAYRVDDARSHAWADRNLLNIPKPAIVPDLHQEFRSAWEEQDNVDLAGLVGSIGVFARVHNEFVDQYAQHAGEVRRN